MELARFTSDCYWPSTHTVQAYRYFSAMKSFPERIYFS